MKIMSEKAGFYENWWKSLWFHLMQTDHNLCQIFALINFWHSQSEELKWNNLQNGTKYLNF